MIHKIGEVVRYGEGSTALMKITGVNKNHGGHVRYYGTQFYGGIVGAYESDISKASAKEHVKFETDNHLGRLHNK